MTKRKAFSPVGARYDALLRELGLAMTVADIRSAYLVTVGHVLQAEAIGFYRLGQSPTETPLEVSANLGSEFLTDYEAFGRRDDPVLDFVIRHGLPVDSERLRKAEWKGSGAREVLFRSGLVHSMQAPLIQSGHLLGTINFARSESLGPFRDWELSTASALSQHLSLALERAHRYEVMETRVSVLEGALERGAQAAMICGPDGDPVFVSKRAVELLDASVVTDNPGGVSARVRRVIRSFAEEGGYALTCHVDDPATGRRFIVKLHRLRRRNAIVCFLYAESDARGTMLPSADVLSPREQEIAGMVSRGLTTKEMAAAAFVSENTIKQHLKRIFAKLSVTSRAELVQLVWSLHDVDDRGRIPAGNASSANMSATGSASS